MLRTILLLAVLGTWAGPASAGPSAITGGELFRLERPHWQDRTAGPDRYRASDLRDTRHLAEFGDVGSQFNLAVMYSSRGRNVEAEYWFRQAALRGHPAAAYDLGVMYLEGRAVPRDPVAAADWFRAAAERGLAEAAFQLGRMYYSGDGVGRDPHEEQRWYRYAAEHGSAIAQHELAVLYHLGEGVGPDEVTAWAWFATADANGFDSRDELAIVGALLDDRQRAAAVALAAELRGSVRTAR